MSGSDPHAPAADHGGWGGGDHGVLDYPGRGQTCVMLNVCDDWKFSTNNLQLVKKITHKTNTPYLVVVRALNLLLHGGLRFLTAATAPQ